MTKKINKTFFKKVTAVSMTIVLFLCILGNNYMNQSIDKQKENIVLTANSQINQLKSADEIQLATTDTEMGKVSEEVIKVYEVLESTYENDVDNIHNAVTEFEKNVSDLKDKAVTVLSNTNGKNESIKEYQRIYIFGF